MRQVCILLGIVAFLSGCTEEKTALPTAGELSSPVPQPTEDRSKEPDGQDPKDRPPASRSEVPTSRAGPAGPERDGGETAVRLKRMARWSLVFNTRDGEDYLHQLDALGAIIGIPTEEPEKFLIIRDLKQPNPQKEDVTKITLIRWSDTRPDSVAGLARALRLPNVPQTIWAFFPRKFEQQLWKAEHDYKGLQEDQIAETKFQIVRRGDWCVPVVRDQQAAPR